MRALAPFLLLLAACGPQGNGGKWPGKDRPAEDFSFPVRVVAPERGEVEDYVENQATLEADRRADVHAEVEGPIAEKLKDLGDRVGGDANGADPFVLARIDDRDLALALRDAEIALEEAEGRTRELELEVQRNERELERARVLLAEAESVLARTTSGIQDGTISREEHETAGFARNSAASQVQSAESAVAKAKVSLTIGRVTEKKAEVARERAALALAKATVRAPLAGVVTACEVREGERVRVGDLLYQVADPASLIVYGEIPVRQATRVSAGDPVLVTSSATPAGTTGRVELVAPTVERESGAVRCKIAVEPAEGFKPGLFVTLRIVVETRADALTVPKRAVLHDDEEGAYLFVVEDGKAKRLLVATGFEKGDRVEIADGLAEDAAVIVEGQDTVTDGADVDVQDGA